MSVTPVERPQVEAFFRQVVKEELAPVYELLTQLLEGTQTAVEGQRRLEEQLIHRRHLDDLHRRFDEKLFDPARALAALEPLRDDERAIDRREVSRGFSELRCKKAGQRVKGSTLARLIRAMGLDPVDVDEDLRVAEVGR